MGYLMHALLIGAGATALMDLWGAVRQPLLGFARFDFALLGRWIGHLARGKFRHQAITSATPIRAERVLGWLGHYLIGIAFAALLLMGTGLGWLDRPTPAPALLLGIGSVVAPLLILHPAMGAGIASARAPRPWRARFQALLSHAIYGVGLYLAAWLDHLLFIR